MFPAGSLRNKNWGNRGFETPISLRNVDKSCEAEVLENRYYRRNYKMAYSKRPMRRSALIGPWGVGAIVPFPNDESLMIAGLDMWRYNKKEDFIIKDDRLKNVSALANCAGLRTIEKKILILKTVTLQYQQLDFPLGIIVHIVAL